MKRMLDRCPVCDSATTPRLTIANPYLREIDPLSVNECNSCRLVFVADEVTPEQLDVVYGRGGETYADTYYAVTEFEARAKAERAVNDVRAIIPSDAAPVLDIGFGYGHFLEAFSAGGDPPVIGQEFSSVHLARWHDRGVQTTKQFADLDAELCSAAVMLDVAEHVIDANETFAEVNRVLRPNGLLYIHTPRRCAWDSVAIAGARSPLRRLAVAWLRARVSIAHLRLWSDQALNTSLERSGFVVESFERELELSWPVREYVRVYLAHKIRPAWLGRAVEVTITAAVSVPLRLGLLRNKAIVVARKV